MSGLGSFEIERTVPMNMYSMSKSRCCVTSIVGFLLLLTVGIVGWLGPPIYNYQVATSNTTTHVEGTGFVSSIVLFL